MLHIGNDVNFCQEFSDALPGFSGKDFYCNLSSVSNGSLKHSEGICSHQAKKKTAKNIQIQEKITTFVFPLYIIEETNITLYTVPKPPRPTLLVRLKLSVADLNSA
jgi:hypothetical protein